MNAPTLQPLSSPDAGMFGRRLRHERGARIPVTVITGFLGAGKTTLLKRFLSTPEGGNTAIVLNEFGAAGIDDALLRSSADETVLLGNGCLCCNVRSDLQVALRRLVADREQGRVPHFDKVVIETSGLADPGPILRTFASDRALGDVFHMQKVVTAADAVGGVRILEEFSEARRQVMVADCLVVTKTDLADASAIIALTGALRRFNPRAGIETAVAGELDPRHITDASVDAGARALPGFYVEAVHADDIGSFVLTYETAIRWNVFAQSMETLVALRGADLLRVKGLLNIAGCNGPVVVQFVQHVAHPPVELQNWPDDDRDSRIVFITRGVSAEEVTHLFDAVEMLAIGRGS